MTTRNELMKRLVDIYGFENMERITTHYGDLIGHMVLTEPDGLAPLRCNIMIFVYDWAMVEKGSHHIAKRSAYRTDDSYVLVLFTPDVVAYAPHKILREIEDMYDGIYVGRIEDVKLWIDSYDIEDSHLINKAEVSRCALEFSCKLTDWVRWDYEDGKKLVQFILPPTHEETPMTEKERIITELKKHGWRDMAWKSGVFYTLYRQFAVRQPLETYWVGNPSAKAPNREIHECAILILDENDLENFKKVDQLDFILKANTEHDVHTLILLTGTALARWNHNEAFIVHLCNVHNIFVAGFLAGKLGIRQFRLSITGALIHELVKWTTWDKWEYKFETQNGYATLRLGQKVTEYTYSTHGSQNAGTWSEFMRQTRKRGYSTYEEPFSFEGQRASHQAEQEAQSAFEELLRRRFEQMFGHFASGGSTYAGPPPPAPKAVDMTDWVYWRQQFENCRTYEEAQVIFQREMKAHHPDSNADGDVEVVKSVTRAWAAYKKNHKR